MRSLRLAIVATLVLGVTGTPPALGHAVLTRTSLDEARVHAGGATTIMLRFNAAIEPGFTRVLLVNERHDERVLKVLPSGAPGTVTVALPPLAAGAYGLRYKVLAADGHVTESLVRFDVLDTE